MNTKRIFSSGLLGLMVGCGLPATESDVKMAGVGLNPDEIGQIPDMHGGMVEYSVFDFSGGSLPLGLLGFTSYDSVGSDVGFRPPYRLVYGQGFVFQDDMTSPDALFGSLPASPDAVGFCQTRFEPRSYLSSVADVGGNISFKTDDGTGGFSMGRRPLVYPPDTRDVFTYYSEIDTWRSEARSRPSRIDPNNQSPGSFDTALAQLANFPEGKEVTMHFPGGMPPMETSGASIPVPLRSSASGASYRLPHFPAGVRLSWNGPAYDTFGRIIEATEATLTAPEGEELVDMDAENAACLQYLSHLEAPRTVTDCLELAAAPRSAADFGARGLNMTQAELIGQMYTGPWDAMPDEDGRQGVRFQWEPGRTGNQERVSLTVRFLGPIDFEDDNMVEGVVYMPEVQMPSDEADLEGVSEAWQEAIDDGSIPSGTEVPTGRRPMLACDEPDGFAENEVRDAETPIEWPMDDALLDADGNTRSSLQGDPLHTLAEVSCRLDDSAGEFVLTQEVLDRAMEYAAARGGEGVVFYFSRSTTSRVDAPPVRDSNGKRHNTSSIKIVSRAVQIGRFWYGQ
jgi:hypothetical protein